MTIIVSEDGQNSQKLETSDFPTEDYLQKYISDNPESIPLYDINENIKLLMIAREFPTTSGPIDALGIDQEGQIYIIETKLYRNQDKRSVVAQILDYGASFCKNYQDFDEFITKIENETEGKFQFSFDQRLHEFFGIDDEDVASIRKNMRENINKGNLQFVILMDKLHMQLKDLIIYLNKSSDFHIYPVELEYYKFKGYEIIIPKLYGTEVKKSVSYERAGVREEKYHLDKCDEGIKTLYNELKKKVQSFGKDVSIEPLKKYIKFKRNTNFMDVVFQKTDIVLYLNMKMGTLNDERLQEKFRSFDNDYARDVTRIGHYGNGDYEFTIYEPKDIEPILEFVKKSYEKN